MDRLCGRNVKGNVRTLQLQMPAVVLTCIAWVFLDEIHSWLVSCTQK